MCTSKQWPLETDSRMCRKVATCALVCSSTPPVHACDSSAPPGEAGTRGSEEIRTRDRTPVRAMGARRRDCRRALCTRRYHIRRKPSTAAQSMASAAARAARPMRQARITRANPAEASQTSPSCRTGWTTCNLTGAWRSAAASASEVLREVLKLHGDFTAERPLPASSKASTCDPSRCGRTAEYPSTGDSPFDWRTMVYLGRVVPPFRWRTTTYWGVEEPLLPPCIA
mmetsp:Transcript_30962/g.92101  ORF Transcript_30962/g.92101 Transcript_30962/m.92101 type:complete len:227 (+) Transcript_30962:1216-1896(+)